MVEYECPRCGYLTNRKSSINKHLNRKSLCKLNNIDVDPRTIKDAILLGNVNQLKVKNNEINELKKKIKELEEEKHLTINNNTTNNNITIVLRPAHDPECEFLTDRDYQQCLNRMIMSVPNLIRKIHFNPKHPNQVQIRKS